MLLLNLLSLQCIMRKFIEHLEKNDAEMSWLELAFVSLNAPFCYWHFPATILQNS